MSNYQDRPLIEYIPTVLREVRQYQALINSEQPEIFNLFAEIQVALDNQFVLTSTKYGVERWEKMLKITPKATYTLDERKFTILSRLAEELPFTYRMLERILTDLCGAGGYRMEINHNDFELIVEVELTALNNFNDVETMLKRIGPANLIIKLSIRFNQHYVLKGFTHEFLRDYTHYQVRTYPFTLTFNLNEDLARFAHNRLKNYIHHNLRNGVIT
jgi:hypothetical protein